MDFAEALALFEQLSKTRQRDLLEDVLESSVRYARIRTDRYLADLDRRREMDESRTRAHNALIDAFNILGRNMKKQGEDASWWEQLGQNRQRIGDFACYIHCILGLKAA